MLLAATAAIVLLAHARRPWPRRRLDGVLAALAALGTLNWLNYGAFHGERVFVHLHDVAHYYMGAKYYGELGYSDLYVALLRAEAENHDDHFLALEARDLRDYRVVHIRTLLQRSEPVKRAFTPERWLDFRRDAEYFRSRLGAQYGAVLLDHGFNPTPVWAFVGGAFARCVPAGSASGIFLLTLIDPLLLLASFAALGWAFGRRVLLLSVLLFTVIPGATFGWVGGAFLRFGWFFGLTAGLACMRKRKWGVAGALFALATMLRVFPIFFLLPLAARTAWQWKNRRSRYAHFAAGFALAAGLLFLATLSLPRGVRHWVEFRENMTTHLAAISPNVVGVTDLLAHGWTGPELVNQEEFDALIARRQRIRGWQLVLVFAPLVVLVACAVRRRSDLGSVALGFPLLLSGLSLAAYYYSFLVLLVPIFRRSPRALAALFACEALSNALRLFAHEDARGFVYRTLVLAGLYALLLFRRSRPRASRF